MKTKQLYVAFNSRVRSITKLFQVEEKRKYLGGDLEHSVLVKGLDFALLEQIKARAEAATEDDDLLELAYKGDTPEQSSQQPDVSSSKKRTREDIIKELKNKRAKGDIDSSAQSLTSEKDIETAKKEGKFKPIGFKPIGSSEKSKTGSEDKKKKKKKRKVIEEKVKVLEKPSDTQAQEDKPDNKGVVTEQPTGKGLDIAPEPASESIDDDFDIFADAGEYEGINLDDDDDENDVNEDVPRPRPSKESNKEHSKEAIRDAQEHQEPRQKWFTDIEPPFPSPEREIPPISDKKGKNKENSDSPEDFDQETEEPEPEAPTRLAPLASSTVPSIRDILAADSALEAEQKRKERKEKRKAGKGGSEVKISDEAKLNRDFQKLKSYTNKKNSVT